MLFDTRITTPYPGLRTFEEYETPIFFGREDQSDQLIEKLRGNQHFLAVLGLSGSGKSSLVRTGLLAGLRRGFLDEAGIRWRVAEMRPGDQPFANLARALLTEALQEEYARHFQQGNPQPFLQADLQRNETSLHELLQTCGFPDNVNLLLLVDQFEEIFRYQDRHPDQATAFVKLLLTSMSPWTAARPQPRHRIYIVLTMRSEQIGQCALFERLPEAINQGLFLVPRLTGDQLRAAIAGPARVFGGQVADELVAQLVTDVGTHFDQLPLLQHALMRMWNVARQENPATPPTLTLAHYHAVGGFQEALTQHGNEIYDHLPPVSQAVAEKLFRSLTNGLSDQYDTRRPVPIQEVATLARVNWQDVAPVVEAYRGEGCHFLTPFPDSGVKPDRSSRPVRFGDSPSQPQQLQADTVIDLTHESLIRQWQRLKEWAQQEAEDAHLYRRLEEAAIRWQAGQGALWRDPDLAVGLAWQARAKPTDTWARRYGEQFDLAMQFLVTSQETQQEDLQRLERQNELALRVVRTLTHDFVGKLIEIPRTLPIVSQVIDANVATLEEISALFPETAAAQREKAANLLFMGDLWELLGQTDKRLDAYQRGHEIFSKLAQDDPNNAQAQRDVSVSLDNIGNVQGQQGDTQAALEAYQQSLTVSKRLAQDDPNNAQAQRDVSISWEKMGNVQLQQGDTQAALAAYQQSLTISQRLAQDDPNNAQAQRDVSVSWDKMGNVQLQQGNTQAALEAYQQSLTSLQKLAQDDPNNAQAQRDLWLSYYKIGEVHRTTEDWETALQSYQRALPIAEPLAFLDTSNQQAQQDLGYVLGRVVEMLNRQGRSEEALAIYDRLIEKDTSFLLTRAALHYSLGHQDAFQQDVQRFEEGVTPQEAAETLNSLGWEWGETYGLYPLAFELLTRAVQLAPDNPHILDSLGWVLYKLDNLAESLPYLRQAYARLDETVSEELAVEIGLHVGEVLGASGEPGEAKQVWEDMLKKYPENEVLRERVKQVA